MANPKLRKNIKKKDIQTKEYIFLNLAWHPLIYAMGYPKFSVSNQKKESISIYIQYTIKFHI